MEPAGPTEVTFHFCRDIKRPDTPDLLSAEGDKERAVDIVKTARLPCPYSIIQFRHFEGKFVVVIPDLFRWKEGYESRTLIVNAAGAVVEDGFATKALTNRD
jgi:hypothetical protein